MIIVSSIFCFAEFLSKSVSDWRKHTVELDTDFDTDVLVPSREYEAGKETTIAKDSTEPAAVAADIVLFGDWSPLCQWRANAAVPAAVRALVRCGQPGRCGGGGSSFDPGFISSMWRAISGGRLCPYAAPI